MVTGKSIYGSFRYSYAKIKHVIRQRPRLKTGVKNIQDMPAVGIDLGTTNSCVAVYKNGEVQVIENYFGNRVTPSYVSFNEKERLIGEVAKEDDLANSENILFQIKRLIGRKFSDPTVQEDMELWPFRVMEYDEQPSIQVTYKGKIKKFLPEQISAMILENLVESAEASMGTNITDAVITVPAYFNDAQRKATRDAGRIAGLNVLSIINEPTAAAIAFGLDRKSEEKRNVLIYDLGGGTFDVSVVTIDNETFTVKATGGDTHLGGEDFTNRLLKKSMDELKIKHGLDVAENKKHMSRLRNACEKAKEKLSAAKKAKIKVDGLLDGKDFESEISRAKFIDINSKLFAKTIYYVEQVIKDARLEMDDIDHVILVGGSTRIPEVRNRLQEVFGGAKKYSKMEVLIKSLHPDHAIAYGAAALAENLISEERKIKERFQLHDVIPLSIGAVKGNSQMHIVLPRNTQIPTSEKFGFTTTKPDQKSVKFEVYEGEMQNVNDNHYLGSFTLDGIRKAPAGKPVLVAIFDIDRSGILNVTAYDMYSGNMNNIRISNDERRLSENEISRMISEEEKMKAEDIEARDKRDAMNEVDELMLRITSILESQPSISTTNKETVEERLQDAKDLLDSSKNLVPRARLETVLKKNSYSNNADIEQIKQMILVLEDVHRALRGFASDSTF